MGRPLDQFGANRRQRLLRPHTNTHGYTTLTIDKSSLYFWRKDVSSFDLAISSLTRSLNASADGGISVNDMLNWELNFTQID